MPAKKTRKSPAGSKRKTIKRVGAAAKKVRKKASKAIAGATKRAKAVASNPKRTVRKAASSVHKTATRARDIGDSVVSAGELIRDTAALVDSIAQRAETRTRRNAVGAKKPRRRQ